MSQTPDPKSLPDTAPAPVPTDGLSRFALAVGRVIPDAMSTAVAMMMVLAGVALAIGNTTTATLDAFYRGFWMLLPFTMQMTLILVLSATLGAAPWFQRLVAGLSRWPRTRAGVFGLATLTTGALAYVYWGLGLALAPIIAIHFARRAEERGLRVDFPFLLATTAAAAAVWQFGLSATAPLLVNTPGHFLEEKTGLIPLTATIWTPAAVLFVVGFLLLLWLAAQWLHPRSPQLISSFPDAERLAAASAPVAAEPVASPPASPRESPSERIERSRWGAVLLLLALGAWLFHHVVNKNLGLDLNSLNTTLLALCLLLHRNVRDFGRALQGAIVTCWPIVVLYHLYAGVAGLIQFTTVGQKFATAFAAMSTEWTFPLLTTLASTVVAIFVPSSGGQWVIQGFVTVETAQAVGSSVERGLLALSVGDQMGNLMTPFWAVIFAGIARIDFRKFIGYSLVFAAIWFVWGVVAFTFLPV